MSNELDPIIDQWYSHLDKGQRFFVTAVDDDERAIEVQHFDGDLEEFSFEQWRELDIALSEEPENWSGALDIVNRDDLGTEVTDTAVRDWRQPMREIRSSSQGKLAPEGLDTAESYDPEDRVDTSALVERADGEYQEELGDMWMAEYAEDDDSGLWQVTIYHRDIEEWFANDFSSLEYAVAAAHEYYAQI
jgi:hypothetical protein